MFQRIGLTSGKTYFCLSQIQSGLNGAHELFHISFGQLKVVDEELGITLNRELDLKRWESLPGGAVLRNAFALSVQDLFKTFTYDPCQGNAVLESVQLTFVKQSLCPILEKKETSGSDNTLPAANNSPLII